MTAGYVTAKQVSAVTSWSERHVHRTARKRNWAHRLSESVGRNGKREREYALSALPADAQLRLLQSGALRGDVVVTSEAILEKRGETLPLFASMTAHPSRERVDLPDEDRKEADLRFTIISPIIGHATGQRVQVDAEGKRLPLRAIVEQVATRSRKTELTIWRWWAAWKKGGYVALARKIRKDRGKPRILEAFPAACAFVQNKRLIEGLNASHVYEVLARDWSKLAKGKPPSYATVRRYLDTIPLPVKTLCREGREAFVSKCAPFVLRQAPPAMQWWISDHRRLDVFCRNTLFPHLGRNQMYRPWLTAVYDWGSRMLVGFAFSPTPSSATIGSALRMAARELGFPAHLYWDNGEDFKKVKRELQAIQMAPQIADLLHVKQVKVTSALPKHPRSKPVEAYFVRWSVRFDAMWGAAYAGNRPQNCRPECREAQRQHKEFLDEKRRESPLPTDEALVAAAREWIWEYNYETKLEALDGRTPENVMNEQYPAASRRPASEIDLTRLLSEKCERKILAGGCVEIDRMSYQPDDASLGPLAHAQGKRLTILRDPYNLGDAAAIDERGGYVGSLKLKVLVNQDPESAITRDDIKEGMRRQRAILRACRDYQELLKSTAAMQGWKWEHELLLERATSRTGTDHFAAAKAAAPGARRPALPAEAASATASPFVSDSVAKYRGAFDDVIEVSE